MSVFIKDKQLTLEKMNEGMQRKILGYQENLMLVKVFFEKGSAAAMHSHSHQQIGYIMEGTFDLEIGGQREILTAGDSFVVAANILHGATCLEKGVIIDSFSPMREDFLK
jgi:quercetin dioxygenase-like cupin family protein